jgi:putative oxidoreductase
MKNKITLGAQLFLGLLYFVFGLNGFLNFIPPPADAMPEKAMAYMTGMMASGYFFPFLKGTEVIAGLMLLTGIFAPVGLLVLASITINILLFHTILTPGIQFAVMPVVMVVLHGLAASRYWKLYRPLFRKGF